MTTGQLPKAQCANTNYIYCIIFAKFAFTLFCVVVVVAVCVIVVIICITWTDGETMLLLLLLLRLLLLLLHVSADWQRQLERDARPACRQSVCVCVLSFCTLFARVLDRERSREIWLNKCAAEQRCCCLHIIYFRVMMSTALLRVKITTHWMGGGLWGWSGGPQVPLRQREQHSCAKDIL